MNSKININDFYMYKKCLVLILIREIFLDNILSWWGCVEIGSSFCWWEYKLVDFFGSLGWFCVCIC